MSVAKQSTIDTENKIVNEWSPSSRINKLLEAHTKSKAGLGAERAIHYTEFYKKKGGAYKNTSILKAEALAYHLRKRSIRIHKHELIVGSHTEHRIGAICHIELAGFAMLEDLFRFEKRAVNPLYVDPKSRRKLVFSVIPYWLTKNLSAKAFPLFQGMKYMYEQLNAKQFVINEAGGIAHFLPNYAELITLGTQGLNAKIEQQAQNNLSQPQQNQQNAHKIALKGLEHFAARYRQLAIENNNFEIAKLLERSPYKPAETLQEALQTIWFFQMVIQIESLDQGISLGRIDQYLYPLYLKEKTKDNFDPNHIRDLFCAFCIKLSEVIPLFSERVTEMFSGLPSGQAATIGGLDEHLKDASNELSFLLLDVIDQFKTRQPNWHTRIHKYTCSKFKHRIFEVVGNGGGSPALYNDDIIIPALQKRFPQTNSIWNYATVGCVEPALSGESFTSSDAAIFNFALVLETIITSPKIIKKIKSMEDLWSILAKELTNQVNYLQYCLDHIEIANKDSHPTPFSSLTVSGAIETSTDLSAGGANFNASGIQAVGIADLANSLVAIEELIYKQQKTTLDELALACSNNFKDQKNLHARLLSCEKFGNDAPQVDAIAGKLVKMFDAEISSRKNTRGGRWMPGFYSMTCHQSMGKQMSALPSGRLQGEALADGLAPTDGSDKLGPTASLNSIVSIDHSIFSNGINLNIKFNAETIKGKKGTFILEGLITGYFEQGGMQVQINVLDPQILLAARNAPEKHQNLLVRVSGYSAYFVDLTPRMQDEIIKRTLQDI